MTVDALPPYLSARVRPSDTGCWEWVGSIRPNGYGAIRAADTKRKEGAHRLVYRMLVGVIPVGLTIDHLCRNRRCVNPAHLEPVTQRENVLRGDGPVTSRVRALARTECKRGHPLTLDNVYLYRNARNCKTCRRASSHARRVPFVPPAACIRGHEFNEANTYYRRDRYGRVCRKCRVASVAAAKRKARSAA